jgi:hypothetical protein
MLDGVDMQPLQCGITALLLFIIGIVVAQLHLRRQREVWRELARLKGLKFESGHLFRTPRAFGAYRGRVLLLDTTMRRGYKHWIYYTRIRLSVSNPANVHLELREKNISTKVGKVLGADDIELGDQGLDERFAIKSQSAELVTVLLASTDICARLLRTERICLLKVLDGEVHLEQRGINYDTESLQNLVDLLSDLAEAIEREAYLGQGISVEEFVRQRTPTRAQSLLWLLLILAIGLVALSPYLCLLILDVWFR